MQDFEAKRRARIDRDRQFTIGGEILIYRASVRPEAMLEWSTITPGATDDESLPLLDNLVQQFVTEQSFEKWKALRQVDGDEALNLEDITDVIEWLVERQSGRPTESSSASADGSQTTSTGTSSTDESPSTPAAMPRAMTFGD